MDKTIRIIYIHFDTVLPSGEANKITPACPRQYTSWAKKEEETVLNYFQKWIDRNRLPGLVIHCTYNNEIFSNKFRISVGKRDI